MIGRRKFLQWLGGAGAALSGLFGTKKASEAADVPTPVLQAFGRDWYPKMQLDPQSNTEGILGWVSTDGLFVPSRLQGNPFRAHEDFVRFLLEPWYRRMDLTQELDIGAPPWDMNQEIDYRRRSYEKERDVHIWDYDGAPKTTTQEGSIIINAGRGESVRQSLRRAVQTLKNDDPSNIPPVSSMG